MLVDDIIAALSRTFKELELNNSKTFNVEVVSNERKKRARVEIRIENKAISEPYKRSLQEIVLAWLPHIVILVLGIFTLWGLFKFPGCRPNRSVTYSCDNTITVTNDVQSALQFQFFQQTHGWVTNKWD